MNAVEIEQAISELAEKPFDRQEFPFQFLEAFGNKDTTLKRLRSGVSNKSDLGGVLQTNNIHIATCAPGQTSATIAALRSSPATTKGKARFILATDGETLEAEDLTTDDPPVACAYPDFHDHFGFFLPLAGITTVKQIRESAFDIKATGRLNRLYVELLKDNPEWGTEARRHDMNHFMARLIFCFFAEDTGIFNGGTLFTTTVSQFSDPASTNTHWVISEIFRAMNTRLDMRPKSDLRNWANAFPYVNGGLFSGDTDVPRFSKIARSYLLHIGSLDWTKINPDIFGSMIQAVADEGERSALGMHYTSVPNILKVLNPLFLDDLHAQLEEAGDNPRKLLNLRNRMAKIRVFDPACGSGNFLVIAYKEMRAIEAVINQRRGEADVKTAIPKTNFRGIELRDFAAEIARLALIIAEFQCDVTYRGEVQARAEFLPLNAQNWITQGNALRLDWLSICPPTGTGVRYHAEDLFHTPLDQAQIDFENEGGETYICGNPPYAGLSSQEQAQKDDLQFLFDGVSKYWKSFDYVCGWFWKAANFFKATTGKCAFVTTNSICQGQQVPMFWPLVLSRPMRIEFAHTSFKWSNLAAKNAGVTVVVVGIGAETGKMPTLFMEEQTGRPYAAIVENINAYLVAGPECYIEPISSAPKGRPTMFWGNKPVDGGFLLMTVEEASALAAGEPRLKKFLKYYYGSTEFIKGSPRACIWVDDDDMAEAGSFIELTSRFSKVKEFRQMSKAKETRPSAAYPHRFRQIQGLPASPSIVVPIHTSESRAYLPVGILNGDAIISNAAYAIYNPETWNMALIASRLHLVWIATVCGKIKTDFRYSNTLGWNTFPVPTLTEKNKADLTACAEDILLAREAHFPATIADLYDPEKMPENLRAAHDRNDETLERIYIGRRFKNDTERLEKLFEMYTKMTTSPSTRGKRA
ncbi:class I SAM-dependent DNA methyltransferase [Pseudogemmobacter bohemicus]|uniref:class I SAM-dependent DNA methyltransferase n=1 Tax=Pseudogemmobacter bohemicus TaxID=2250708 RepID=UPI000DD44CA6|nr:DNA methyltransferase [Pseudogemmobacter bohemicus]